MLFYVLPGLTFSGILLNSRRTKKHFTSFIKEGSVHQEWLHPDWLVEWPKASPSTVRRRPASVAMWQWCVIYFVYCPWLAWLFLGRAVRFPSLGLCGCMGRIELGLRAETEQNAKAGKLCGLFPLDGGSPPLLLRSAPASPLRTGTGVPGASHPPSWHCLFPGQLQADLQLWHLAWEGHGLYPTQLVSHSHVVQTVGCSLPFCTRVLPQNPVIRQALSSNLSPLIPEASPHVSRETGKMLVLRGLCSGFLVSSRPRQTGHTHWPSSAPSSLRDHQSSYAACSDKGHW